MSPLSATLFPSCLQEFDDAASSPRSLRTPRVSKANAGKTRSLEDKPEPLDWKNERATRRTIGLEGGWKVHGDSLESLLRTLKDQSFHAQTARSQTLPDNSASLAWKQSSGMRKSFSAPNVEHVKQLPHCLSGSAKFSFGPGFQKPGALKGKMKIPVAGPRDAEYGASFAVPGPGAYEIRGTIGNLNEEVGGGATGGWDAASHSTFVRVFNSFHQQATPEFFDRVSVLLKDLPRMRIVDHVRWVADYEKHKMSLDHKNLIFREERLVEEDKTWEEGSPDIPKALLAQLESSKADRRETFVRVQSLCRQLYGQADAEMHRWGLKNLRSAADGFKPVQLHRGAPLPDANLRAHPQYKKSLGYSWSASTELRDPSVRNLTELAEVRGTTRLTNPGPGHYDVKQEVTEKSAPCYSVPQCPIRDTRGLPKPNMDLARRAAEVDRRMKAAGASNGELTISLVWNVPATLDLHVVPPGGSKGKRELSHSCRSLFGGRMDCCKLDDPGRSGSKYGALENVTWPPFLGTCAPPVGHYQVYLSVDPGAVKEATPWLCRLRMGQHSHWFAGQVKPDESGHIGVISFKYEGPQDSSTKVQDQLAATQLQKPAYTIGKQAARLDNCDVVSTTPAVGPGSYEQWTSLHSQF